MNNNYKTLPGNARNGTSNFITYWRTSTYEYALITQHDWKPVIWQRQVSPTYGSWSSFDLSVTRLGLVGVDDSHKAVSVAVDSLGYVHVRGNTHDTMNLTVRSVNPHDITAWEDAPNIEKQARYFTNLVENGVVENSTTGWSAIDSRFSLDRVTHSYGWGSSNGNDTNCKALRLTRTASSPDEWIGIGQAYSLSGGGFPVVSGNKYNASLSFRCSLADSVQVSHQMWLIWRNGNTEMSRSASEVRSSTSSSQWFRPSLVEVVAPPNTDNVVIEFATKVVSGDASVGGSVWVDGAMLTEGNRAGDIVYRDGSFNGGYVETGWTWNGAAYASTSTGPIRAPGYAGMPQLGYDRYQSFSDGELVLSGSQAVYVNDPVGRAWTMWKLPVGSRDWVPLIDGSDGVIMRNTMTNVKQGSSYPILSEGNPADDDFIADRAYAYLLWIDAKDTMHLIAGFRVKTSQSNADEAFYVKSFDRGQTWQTISGHNVPTPFTYRATLDQPNSPKILIDDTTSQALATPGGMTIDPEGNPHSVISGAAGLHHVWWDGTTWRREDLSSYNFLADPSPVYIRGDLWLFGVKAVFGKGSRALWGVNHTKNTGTIVRLGAADRGTPDGVYQFESGATYQAAPVHAGGMDSIGNYIYRVSLPDNNSPRIVQFGAGSRNVIV